MLEKVGHRLFGIRERNLLGRGQDLSLALTASPKRQQIDLSFTEPYLLEQNVSGGFDAFKRRIAPPRRGNERSFNRYDRKGRAPERPRGPTVAAPRGKGQKSLSRPALAEDRQTIGWLGNYDNCCQSYPIPRQLVIWKSGRILRRIDVQAMVWNWRFYLGGKAVGFSDGPTHAPNADNPAVASATAHQGR